MSLKLDGTLLLAGAGKMGGAMLSGWLEGGLDPNSVTIQDPGPPPEVAALLAQHGIVSAASLPERSDKPAVLILAVKPQIMDDVLPTLAPHVGPQTLVLSIAAGRTIASLAAHLPEATAIVRAMPNTPAAVGRGITVCCPNAGVTAAQRELCTALLSAVGEVGWVEDEGLMDAVTAVSGSGPAYVFLLAECMAAAGREAGLASELANQLARATVAGSGELLRQSGEDAGTLRKNVTSPGGTTAAALDVLMADDGVQQLLTRAIAAATQRSKDLSG